jgi:hypothetical protein
MKKIICFTLLLTFAAIAQGQNRFKNELGLRFGSGTSIDYRHFVNDKTSLEAMLGFRWRGMLFTGLYEKNFPVIKQVEGFNLYVGGGAHVGFWNSYKVHPWYEENDARNHVALGVDGILGLEYTFKEVPLNLSLDWKPMLNFIDYATFWGGDVGLSVRYAF